MTLHIESAYQYCTQLAKNHYENFPVASWFLPKPMRDPIAAIYAFARVADDYADEGNSLPEQRLADLEQWEAQLLEPQNSDNPIFIALADTLKQYDLSVRL